MDRIEKLLQMLKDQPSDSFLQHALALEYVKAGDDDSARSRFEALLAANPGYTGSYYHLGKLLERQGEDEAAIAIYRKGMEVAQAAGEKHAYGELRGALEELEF
ncbi:tetratricopeptide repeat protein [Nostoc ellipsosporum NOK]|nr:tetratricopeptide repeat protein [Nostoc ellipsosporum NOK]